MKDKKTYSDTGFSRANGLCTLGPHSFSPHSAGRLSSNSCSAALICVFVLREEFAFLFQTFSRSDPPGKKRRRKKKKREKKKKNMAHYSFPTDRPVFNTGETLFIQKQKMGFLTDWRCYPYFTSHFSQILIALGRNVHANARFRLQMVNAGPNRRSRRH